MKKILLKIIRNMLNKYVFDNDKLQENIITAANKKIDIPFASEKDEREMLNMMYNAFEPAFKSEIMNLLGDEPVKKDSGL